MLAPAITAADPAFERELLTALLAFRKGDWSARLPSDLTGVPGKIADVFNEIIDANERVAREFDRVSRVVGREGKLGQRAAVVGVAGGWGTMVQSINTLIDDLVRPTTEMARIIGAVAKGDLEQSMALDVDGRPLEGQFLRTAKTANTMVEQLSSFASEVTRVAREVGTEGKLGGQAKVKGVAGTWKDLTDSVNSMAGNLTAQVRNIAEVTTAVANGDLSKKITVDVRGEILQLKDTINVMVDQLRAFASEVTRVAREVGTEGRLGGQANVPGVAGTWKDLTDSVNSMASNLTAQVRNIAEVTTAVANGNLSRKITVDVKGEILELKDTINVMLDQLNSFASEVTRVAREVGTEGKLGGQAQVKGVGGTWKDLTDSVNVMAANLTDQVRNIAEVTTAVARGDLSKKITVDVKGEILELKDTINVMVDQLSSFAAEVTRVAREVGTEGKLGGQAYVQGVAGTWKDLTDSVNSMASNLTAQVRNIAEVTTAVARGDLSKKITVDVAGEILALKNTVNTMVDQLSSFASEVTRVAWEVGTEGKLGGQAYVQGVGGTWKDLTDSVNVMAANLTNQVRGIAGVVTAVAMGSLEKKLTVEARGEIAALASTINEMTDTLATFAAQVTTVAREVGVEGKLGGQANVPGASGTWKDLTDNVNQLAANLTTQVRAIADVATAVTRGDLTRSVTVDTRGEVAVLKDNINEMIRNLKETTQKNSEQDWLKTNVARFTRLLQGQRELPTVVKLILSELAPLVGAQLGVFYMMEPGGAGEHRLQLVAAYGYRSRRTVPNRFRPGEGLVGQCAVEQKRILLTSVPSNYLRIASGLGEATPRNLVVLPILFEQQVKAVIELASFDEFSPTHLTFLDQLMEGIGVVLNNIEASTRTESLLTQSQTLARELQSRQEELQKTNEELAEKARLLSEQYVEVEHKNREVEQARLALEDKAAQLALSSKYKSEFLANMSHELRTPLNSLLILAQQLAENPHGNLSDKQVDYAKIIHGSGTDLLTLINDILDLSKIESGTVTLEISEMPFAALRDYVERTFRHMAEAKQLGFRVELAPELPAAVMTDPMRLQQILKNLLSNAFKFTETGSVRLSVGRATGGWSPDQEALSSSPMVVAFSVSDSGVGIPQDKLLLIFEAFQQADGTTSRRYGGTGLGLSISRELARLLGGEISVQSEVGVGSRFTLYVPFSEIGVEAGAGLAVEDGVAPRSVRSESRTIPVAAQRSTPAPLPSLGAVPAPAALPASATSVSSSVAPSSLPAPLSLQAPPPLAIADDRAAIEAGDDVVLIVEDDPVFARILLDTARDNGFKGVVSLQGGPVHRLVQSIQPRAVLLDLNLPDAEGWAVLDQLKHDAETRHVPVHILSGRSARDRALRAGARSYLVKPATREQLHAEFAQMRSFMSRERRSLLIVEDDEAQRTAMVELLGADDVEIALAGSGAEALSALAGRPFDCVVLDLTLPDVSGFDLLRRLGNDARLAGVPVVVYTGRELTRREVTTLRKVASTVIVKDVRSPERLLEETALFLHRPQARLSESQRRMLGSAASAEEVLRDRKVLIVDDDVRNIFALTTVLERHQMQVSFAENGRDGIDSLNRAPDTDIVLMDIMMPEMDGYDTIRAIRADPRFGALPIVTLTAKAMKGDREKCIAAGASDYITKPVDTGKLLSLLRVWMSARAGAAA